MTRFKELCMDTARSGAELGSFWAAVTGCTYADSSSATDTGDVVGTEEGMGIAILLVPEAKTVKHRVHLDVHTDSVDSLLALGARKAPGYGGDPWTVLLDPEGGEFCAFVREGELPAYRVYELTVDSVAAEAQARWWADAFGVAPENDEKAYWSVAGVPGMPFESIVFDPVPEPKTVKNRIHWDVYGDVATLEAAGATVVAELPRWTVMADPEGNEFCVFP
ncbi:MAG: VOC family protein [Marmoricola sp.]